MSFSFVYSWDVVFMLNSSALLGWPYTHIFAEAILSAFKIRGHWPNMKSALSTSGQCASLIICCVFVQRLLKRANGSGVDLPPISATVPRHYPLPTTILGGMHNYTKHKNLHWDSWLLKFLSKLSTAAHIYLFLFFNIHEHANRSTFNYMP